MADAAEVRLWLVLLVVDVSSVVVEDSAVVVELQYSLVSPLACLVWTCITHLISVLLAVELLDMVPLVVCEAEPVVVEDELAEVVDVDEAV